MANTNIWDTPIAPAEQENRDFPVLPAGTYEFEVANIDAVAHEPKPGGKIGYCAELDLRLEVEHEGKTVCVFDRLYGAPSTAWRMESFARCIGLEPKNGKQFTPGEIYKDAKLRGGTFKVGQREYNGKIQNDVKEYIKPKQEAPKTKAPDPFNSDDLPF